MMRRLALAMGLAALAAGCGGAPTAPAPTAQVPGAGPVGTPPAPRVEPAMPKMPEAGPSLPPRRYDARQRRDPFRQQVVAETGTKGLQVVSVKLVGVLQGRREPTALVEAPDGIGYILRTGDVLGDGRVAEIGNDSVSFAVTARPGGQPGTVTLRLQKD